MKKFAIIILCLVSGYVSAQYSRPASTYYGPSVRLTGYAIYAFDDNSVDSYYSETAYFEGSIKGGFEYGGSIEIMPSPTAGVELTYLRLDSKAPMNYYDGGVKFTDFDLAHNYLFVGFNKYLPASPKVEPYGGLLLGMGIYNVTHPEENRSVSGTKFAWGLKLGTNVWVSERVGIKLQAGLISAVQAIGGGLYFGTGGAGAGISGFSTYWQFNLGGGLVFRLK